MSDSPQPSLSGQSRLVSKTRDYVIGYVSRFPDFIATESVRQFHNYELGYAPDFFWHDKKLITVDDEWHQSVSYIAEAAYAAGHAYTAKTTGPEKRPDHIIPVSLGELGGMLSEIFKPDHQADFVAGIAGRCSTA